MVSMDEDNTVTSDEGDDDDDDDGPFIIFVLLLVILSVSLLFRCLLTQRKVPMKGYYTDITATRGVSYVTQLTPFGKIYNIPTQTPTNIICGTAIASSFDTRATLCTVSVYACSIIRTFTSYIIVNFKVYSEKAEKRSLKKKEHNTHNHDFQTLYYCRKSEQRGKRENKIKITSYESTIQFTLRT